MQVAESEILHRWNKKDKISKFSTEQLTISHVDICSGTHRAVEVKVTARLVLGDNPGPSIAASGNAKSYPLCVFPHQLKRDSQTSFMKILH